MIDAFFMPLAFGVKLDMPIVLHHIFGSAGFVLSIVRCVATPQPRPCSPRWWPLPPCVGPFPRAFDAPSPLAPSHPALRQISGETVCAAFWLATEASTPFVNVRALQLALGKQNTMAYYINGAALIVNFFLFRIVLSVYYVQFVVANFEVRRALVGRRRAEPRKMMVFSQRPACALFFSCVFFSFACAGNRGQGGAVHVRRLYSAEPVW